MIKILEVNNIDLPGKVFNGYDLINDLKNNFEIKQAVIIKQSNNNNVIKISNDRINPILSKFEDYEKALSIHNVFSITSPILMNSLEYKEANIIHFHMFHNTKLSLASLTKISREKKVVVSLHDPWMLTGRCVHFYECKKWINGCDNCPDLSNIFAFDEDNTNLMWNIKKDILNNSNIDYIVSSDWMYKNALKSQFILNKKRIHLIPFGIDLNRFKNNNNQDELKKELNIPKQNLVLFHRAQKEFKGSEYLLSALKTLNYDNITLINCDQESLFNDLKSKIQVIDLGNIGENKVIDMMNVCDIFLMPSKGEAFGMMALEAMACEKPIIVFDNTSLPSVTYAPKCGVVAKNRDYKDFAKKISFLINNEDERLKRGKLGRKICVDNYSYDKYLDNISELYKKIYSKSKIVKLKEKINNENIEIIMNSVNTFMKKDEIVPFDLNVLKNYKLVNKVNLKLYEDYYLNSKKIKISLYKKIKNIVKNSKFLYKLINKVRG